MDIKAIEEHVQAVKSSWIAGILGVSHNRIQVTSQLFEELLNEKGSLQIVNRDCDVYPFQAEFICNDFTYYNLYTEEELKNTFGGNIDELITSN
ncbi:MULTISPECIES: hypothetical protein [Bacillus cereus group]|uniref:hypothetical protein n=1 Tax=Bacillus cereus group TaxID=86661 RepID=UPI0018CCA2B9|nr:MULTISPECIES: hypothetical protein [Bacillus cereus group]MBG9837924.1 threonyl-tRNA synthetase [Bacillus tropicus]MBG9880155.1 threonyl-tRNA synthetase [Bacillus tropicus]MBG9923403.1 threonyl-tRNA synthetase [Bacillus tropicus]MBJ8355323.1 hypothetical protein [Bacillus mycoides]MED2903907.1 hypothetical protein [Bacillus tropicus]